MFWNSVLAGFGVLGHGKIWLGIFILVAAQFGFLEITYGIFGRSESGGRMAVGCLFTALVGPLFQGFIMSIFVGFYLPMMLGSNETMPSAKDATIRRSLTVLNAILNYAHQDKRFGLPVVPSFKHLMPNDSKPRRGFTDAGKFTKLLALLPEKCRPLATFQFRTGCRTGAALKITQCPSAMSLSSIRRQGCRLHHCLSS
jgi:hypothetical protein